MLRADIDPIARAGLAKATELGEAVVAKAKHAKPPKRRKRWLGPVLALALGGIAFAVIRSRSNSASSNFADDGSANRASGARLGVAESAPEPSIADAR
jgi:hypothetical protein